MLITSVPYFMTNEDWYYHDAEEWRYKLTPKAPIEAIKSYDKLYNNESEGTSKITDNLINVKE